MTKQENLKLLKSLEEFRINLETGKTQAGCPDWIVRVCQAIVAKEHFPTRMDWTEVLRHEQKAIV